MSTCFFTFPQESCQKTACNQGLWPLGLTFQGMTAGLMHLSSALLETGFSIQVLHCSQMHIPTMPVRWHSPLNYHSMCRKKTYLLKKSNTLSVIISVKENHLCPQFVYVHTQIYTNSCRKYFCIAITNLNSLNMH